MDADQWRAEVDGTTSKITRFLTNALDLVVGLPAVGEAAAIWTESLVQRQIVNRMADLYGSITGVNARQILRDNGFGSRAAPQDFTPYGLPMDLSSLVNPPNVGELTDVVLTGESLAQRTTAEVTRQAAITQAQRGMGGFKTWMTQRDLRVRDAHRSMEGVTIPVNEPFVVDGWPMMWPGESSVPQELWINCRCSAVLVLLEDVESA